MRCAAFNTGTEFHMLDHIAPLAEILQIPLITTEPLNRDLSVRYYPQIETRFMPHLEFELKKIAEEFDGLIECKYWAPHLKSLFKEVYKKEMKLILCPHGQSDKGYHYPSLAQYAQQDAVLLYGPLLIEMLQELNIWPSIKNYAIIGNYRLKFYRKYQTFYDDLVEREIFSKLNPKNRTLLYAPTWKDQDQSTSFFRFAPSVISQLPKDWNLIIKLHPLLEQKDPALFYSIAALADPKENVLLIDQFPPVYPILNRADVYLGDHSSVGYDFLAFERPLFFFPTQSVGKIQSCGQLIDPDNPLYRQIETCSDFCAHAQALYKRSFIEIEQDEIKKRIKTLF